MLHTVAEKSPLRRPITTDEIAATAVFLSSNGGAGITGETLYVDAGYNIMGV
jgi:enoyl-[acyl-carrier protein] reductase I